MSGEPRLSWKIWRVCVWKPSVCAFEARVINNALRLKREGSPINAQMEKKKEEETTFCTQLKKKITEKKLLFFFFCPFSPPVVQKYSASPRESPRKKEKRDVCLVWRLLSAGVLNPALFCGFNSVLFEFFFYKSLVADHLKESLIIF